MEDFNLHRTTGRAVKFKGELLSSAFSKRDATTGTNYWLYRTSGGNFVCRSENWTRWQDQRDTDTVIVTKSVEEVFDFFGDGSLAREIYDGAKLDFTEEVD